MPEKRVLLAMSGGTDSSVAAMILKKNGFEVIGITFLFTDSDKNNQTIIQDSNEIAKQLGLAHHIIDLKNEFEEQVVRRFIHEYLNGKTPFPCAFCNPNLKFKYLNEYANKFKCQFIATGHYAKIVEFEGVKYISHAADKDKDQSFFLWGLQSEVINKLIFPLGIWNKTEVRKFAKQNGFEKISNKKDSLGICFVEGGDYRKWLMDRGLDIKQGNFVDVDGNILGTHNGIINYTIGQRHGLGLNLNKRLFVAEIRVKDNTVVLSEYNHLFKQKLYLNETNIADNQSIYSNNIYKLKIRYRLQENFCNVKLIDGKKAIINLKEPVAMVAKGQAAVLYDDERVIGGGFIEDSQ